MKKTCIEMAVDEVGVDKVGEDEIGVVEIFSRRSGTTPS